MNIQAIMKIQKEMLKTKEEIDNTIFNVTKSFVSVKVNGKKEVVEIKIDKEDIQKDEIEIIEDLVMLAINEAGKEVDAVTEKKMGKYTSGLPNIF